ncbi:MAG: hypothetical protein M3Z30_02245 [Gemmatimonadota bacterium]|nr:hypothetical protein [Gemmatimonadota bacterium]
MSQRDKKHATDTNDETKAAVTPVADDTADSAETTPPNPPRTTTDGWFTAPKFGSAGAGGAELEPGPERD